ncbi:MAG: hypothetical protein ACK5WX_07325, partial [bacterium]
VKPQLESEYRASRLSATGMDFKEMLPEPPGLDEARRVLAERAKRRAQQAEEMNRSEAERK